MRDPPDHRCLYGNEGLGSPLEGRALRSRLIRRADAELESVLAPLLEGDAFHAGRNVATCRRHAAALINGVLQGVQSNLGSFRKSRPLRLVGLHVAIEARNKRRLAGVFLDFDLVELEAPLPATVVILVTVDLENRCPLILVALGLEPRVEASPKVGIGRASVRLRYKGCALWRGSMRLPR